MGRDLNLIPHHVVLPLFGKIAEEGGVRTNPRSGDEVSHQITTKFHRNCPSTAGERCVVGSDGHSCRGPQRLPGQDFRPYVTAFFRLTLTFLPAAFNVSPQTP